MAKEKEAGRVWHTVVKQGILETWLESRQELGTALRSCEWQTVILQGRR